MEQTGKVITKPVATGSKSARQAVMLQTADNEFVLRIQGGNPFQDNRLEQLVGKQIRGDGDVHGYTFLMKQWREL